ncbi:MAG: EamA family transporter [Deltaproteobacteria bacterium]|nr:EamA family transporter [Deltaproteobacteria bacterium]
MPWILWLLIAIFGAAIERICNRYVIFKSGKEWEYMLGYNIGAMVLLAALMGKGFGRIEAWILGLLFLSGCFWFVYCWLSFKADRFVEVTVTSILSQLQVVFVCLGGIVFFEEKLAAIQWTGIIVVLLGLCILIQPRQVTLSKGVYYKLISTVAMSAALLFDKKLISVCDPAVVALSGFLIPTLIAITCHPKNVGAASRFIFESRFLNVLMGALAALTYYSIVKAFSVAPISIVFSIFQLSVVLTVLLGILFLHEKDRIMAKLAAAVMVALGTMMLS